MQITFVCVNVFVGDRYECVCESLWVFSSISLSTLLFDTETEGHGLCSWLINEWAPDIPLTPPSRRARVMDIYSQA